jgi:hypothetical protein
MIFLGCSVGFFGGGRGESSQGQNDFRFWLADRTLRIAALTFQSLAVTLRTTRFNIKKCYVVPTLRVCVLYGSQNKQQLLPYKTLRDWFL